MSRRYRVSLQSKLNYNSSTYSLTFFIIYEFFCYVYHTDEVRSLISHLYICPRIPQHSPSNPCGWHWDQTILEKPRRCVTHQRHTSASEIQETKFTSIPWGRGVHSSDVTDYLKAGWGCWQCWSDLEHTWAQSAQHLFSLRGTALQVEGALAGTLARWVILMHSGRLKWKEIK